MQRIKHLYQNPCDNSPYDPEPSLGSGSFWLGAGWAAGARRRRATKSGRAGNHRRREGR